MLKERKLVPHLHYGVIEMPEGRIMYLTEIVTTRYVDQDGTRRDITDDEAKLVHAIIENREASRL